MSSSSLLDATTAPVFRCLAEEISQLRSEYHYDYLDDTRFLLMLVEVAPPPQSSPAPGSGVYETQLRLYAGLPENPFEGVQETIPDEAKRNLRTFIETPRPAKEGGVRHFYSLAEERLDGDYASLLFDLLKGGSSGSLAQISKELSARGASSRTIVARQDKLLARKLDLWNTLRGTLISGDNPLSPQQRNDLDEFIFAFPDIVAVSLPILGSPVVHCYLGVHEDAYSQVPKVLSDLARIRSRLRDAVRPFFLSRLATFASEYIAREAPDSGAPATRVWRFLRAAAGLLVAKSVSLPSGGGNTYVQEDLVAFKSGLNLSVRLPPEWPGGGAANIQLPQFQVPTSEEDGKVSWKWSKELPGTEHQAVPVQILLESLVDLIYRLGEAQESISSQLERLSTQQAKMTKQQESNEKAYSILRDVLRDVRKEIVPRIHDASRTLDVKTRLKLRAFIDAVPKALKGLVVEDVRLLWHKRFQSYPTQPTLGHFLTEEFDKELGGSHEPVAERLREALIHAIAEAADRSAPVQLDVDEKLLAEKLIELLLWTRLTVHGEERAMRSVLGWAKDWELISTTEKYTGSDSLACVRNWSPLSARGCLYLLGRKGWRGGGLKLTFVDPIGVPRFALPLCLSVLGAWAERNEQCASVELRLDSEEGVVVEASVDSSRDRPKTPRAVKDLIGETKETLGTDSFLLDQFAPCLVLLDSIYRVKDSSTLVPERLTASESGFTLNLELPE